MNAGVGVMMNPNIGYSNETIAEWPAWAADNGCFNDNWDADRWLAYLDVRPRDALFAVVPDVVADAAATRERWDEWADMVRSTGHRTAYVLQDGEDGSTVPWDADALFVGGTTGYKISPVAQSIVREGKRRGKHVHMGRVNTWRRIKLAAEWGCDSVDGTFLAFGPDVNTPRLLGWLKRLSGPRQEVLAL